MSETLNALQHASSSYLRSAMHQPVQWNEWGEAAFARAHAENKPVLLDIGAVWCHWCHVMDRESYENNAIAALINENFVAVKVDRDERPDVDSRYQAAVQAISGQGGWPLTAFLTPDGRPFFGGTYFPPEDGYGRAGFKRVLLTLAQAFHEKGDEVEESAQGVMSAVARNETFAGHQGTLSAAIISSLVQSAVKQFDPHHGGFGSQPKFPHPSALDLILDQYSRTGDAELRRVIETTLRHMAQGGVYDQLGGSFHRYSVDDKWIVPHFEKMSYDNSELLKNYVHAYQALGDEFYAEVARDIIRWMDQWLSDRQRGGFYASQDADVSLDDDGDYFTWTLDELRAAVDPAEAELAAAYFDVGPVGEMHHDPLKNVLFVAVSIDQLATRFKIPADEVRTRLQAVKRRMLEARLQRPTPFVDKTVYVSWNALCISAYLQAARALDLAQAREFALKSLDRVLREAWDAQRGLLHVISYADASSASPHVPGVLDDYAFLANACIDAFESAGEPRYLDHAIAITGAMSERFVDRSNGGFFDIEQHNDAEKRIGALAAARKPLQDTPTPAGNPNAAIALSRLAAFTGSKPYLDLACSTLECFATAIEQFGYFASTYGLALTHVLNDHISVVIIGEDAQAEQMYRAACGKFLVNMSVLWLRHADGVQRLPELLRDTISGLAGISAGRTVALLCTGTSCQAPVYTIGGLEQMLSNI